MIPALPIPDASVAFLGDGYRFGSRWCDLLGTDAFRTRLAGRPVIVLRGGEAARLFYEGGRVDRTGAMPPSVAHLLQDELSVQTLEGPAHRLRKEGFLELLAGGGEERMAELFAEEFAALLDRARGAAPLRLHDELGPLLARVAFRWAGIPRLDPSEFRDRAAELAEMVEQAGSFGPANWRARLHRHRTERWAADLVVAVRDGQLVPDPGSPLARLARWRDEEGIPLPERVLAVELLNLLRPIVALARFLEFAAVALAARPGERERIGGDAAAATRFANEVRRHAPFFPVIAGRVRRPFRLHDTELPVGQWLLLDLYGTNHDPRLWADPGRFRPDRFLTEDPRHIVAQGAGDYLDDHRCPGEPASTAVVAAAVRILAAADWALPPQDLRVTWSRMPARIRSGVLLSVR